MPTYLDEKRRRIRQLAEYLRLMGLRAHKVVRDSSFIIFDDAPPEDAESPKLKESVAIKADCLADGGSASGGHGAEGLPKHGKPRKRRSRYLQFAFMRDCFYLELPNNTVFPQEVEQIDDVHAVRPAGRGSVRDLLAEFVELRMQARTPRHNCLKVTLYHVVLPGGFESVSQGPLRPIESLIKGDVPIRMSILVRMTA